jgi:photosystem II stability/assembly factor-like uncharacterized protein
MRKPRHRRIVNSLVGLVAAVVVAVPVGVGLLLRTGAIGGSSAATKPVLDLQMFGATTGWAWAGGTQILHTTSGVEHWTIVPPPIRHLVIIEVAWVNADSARILTTTANVLDNLERTYTLTGWMTDDGGATWREGQPFKVLLEAAQDPTTTTDLDFVDRLHGWFLDTQNFAVGAPTLILRTMDGGLHWSQVEMTPATGNAAPGLLPVGCAAYGMTFLNETTGWVAGECNNATLFDVTRDGGATWTPQAIACTNCSFYPPQFISSRDGQMFGSNGLNVLFVTHDGGRSWSARARPPGNWPDFVDAAHGFTMGLTGNDNPSAVLWTTTDGGASWAQAPNGAIHGSGPEETSQLDFITRQMGWAVSQYITSGGGLLQGGQTPAPTPPPELWQTTDAGSTWAQINPTFATR